jgi:ankyrin repeat protein
MELPVSSKSDNELLLFQLATKGNLDALLQHPHNILSSCRDKNGSTLLHYAAGNGHGYICNYLLQRNIIKVEEPSRNNGRTALHWATRNGHTDICQCLVQSHGAHVDALAKGQVTPLQLAIWQCHLETSQCLVQKLKADPHFPNAWGCGIAHWLGKCPIYDGTSDSVTRLTEACDWLLGHLQVDSNLPNHHGQTPLHKAAFAGNIVVARYLVQTHDILDTIRDDHGNSAADCAERSQQYELARWLRRFASKPVHEAIASLGFINKRRATAADNTSTTTTRTPPSIEEIRMAFLALAMEHHPDKSTNSSSSSSSTTTTSAVPQWNTIRDAYQLLQSWWNDPPELFDCQIRIHCRNARLLENERLCWIPSWHEQEQQTNNISETSTDAQKTATLEEFEYRLVRLLSNDAFRQTGLPLSQLPKEYEKNWHVPVPKPREFGCRKLIYLLQTKCPNVHVESTSESKQAVLRVATYVEHE